MQLETYISDLLYRYDCVVVPGFGAFITNRVSAIVHESTNTFYPPKKVLSFNEQLQGNDALLVNYLAEVEKIPYQVALERINKHIKSIKSFLIAGETIQFENIGDFNLNTDGKIVFEPSHHVNYLTDAFGLSHYSFSDINRITEEEPVKAAPIVLTAEKRVRTPYIKYAAAAILILGLGGFIGLKLYDNSIEKHNIQALEEANKQLDVKVQEATFIIENPLPAVHLELEKQSGKYHVVAGAFRIEANSQKKVEQLRAKGYKARIIGLNKYGLHEVVYSSYEDRLEALQALRKIRRENNRDAWLLVKNLD